MYTINIGLDNPFTKGTNSVDLTLSKALQFVGDITHLRVSYDKAETAVIIRYVTQKGSLSVLATALDQDCISHFDHTTGKGTLIGDKASEWGDFDLGEFQWAEVISIDASKCVAKAGDEDSFSNVD